MDPISAKFAGNLPPGSFNIIHYPSNHNDPTSRGEATGHHTLTDIDVLKQSAVFSAMFDSAARVDAPCVYDETRTLLVDGIRSWVQNREQGVIRCILGHSGVGKSTLAQTIARECRRQDWLVATFFFSRSDPDMNHTKKVVSTLAYQLAHQDKIYKASIEEIFQRSPSILEKSIDVQWSKLIVDIIRQSPPTPSVIILDGLDECENKEEQLHLLQLLALQVSPLAKFIITFRPTLHIQKLLQRLDLNAECLIYLGDSQEDRHDIQQFLRSSFREISRAKALTSGNGDWPSDDAQEKLVNMASGQFRFAAAVIKFIDNDFADPRTLLEDVLAWRSQASQPLDSAYLIDMQRLIADIPPEHHTLIDNLVTFLALHQSHHSHPLSIQAVSEFWSAEPFRVRRLLKFLDSEVIASESDDSIMFRHQSFLKFLSSPTFPHPYQRKDADFSLIAIRSLRIMRNYRSVEEASPGIIESTFAQWLYQCASSTPTLLMIFLLLTMNYNMWLDWAIEQPWSSVDPAYAQFISWVKLQHFLGWLGFWFPPQLLFAARHKWIRQHSNEIVQKVVNEDLHSLFDKGEVKAEECFLLLNMIQEQVLTGGDMLKKFGSDKTENVTVLHQMLNSENFKINALQFPKELLPIENQAWDGITENPVSITSLGKFVGEFIGFITIGLVYYGGLYCQHQYFGLQRPTLGLQMPASGLIVSFFTTCVFAFFLSYSASSPSLPPTTITTTTIYNHPTTITTTIYNHPTTITTTNYNHPITVTTMNYDHSIIMTTTTHTTITTTICDYPTTMTTTTLTLATFIDTKTVTVTSSAHCNYSF